MPDLFKVTEPLAREAVDAVAKQIAAGVQFGHTKPAAGNAAAALGISKENLSKRLRYASKTYGIDPVARAAEMLASGAVVRDDKPSPNAQPGTNEPKPDPILVRRLRTEGDEKTKRVKELENRVIELEDLRSGVFDLGPMNVSKLEPFDPAASEKKHRTIVTMLSDVHYGERVDFEAMDGLNSYNLEIADTRLSRYFKTVHYLAEKTKRDYVLDEVVLLLGGDNVSGELHDNIRTDLLRPIEAMQVFSSRVCSGIELLLELGVKVRILGVVGNHARVGDFKPPSKDHVTNNLDYLAYCMIETYFKNNKNVLFLHPKSVDCLFSIYGFANLLQHGDRGGAGGSVGQIGAIAKIVRMQRKLHADYKDRRITLYKTFTGHFHSNAYTKHGIAAGSVVGANEYSQMFRLDTLAPMMPYTVWHPKHGLIEYRELNIGDPSEGTSCSPAGGSALH